MNISVRVTFQGAYELSTTINGVYIHHQYMGYSLREAKQLFKQLCATSAEQS